MSAKNKTNTQKAPSYKQQLDQLRQSLVLLVLGNPNIEHEIVHNFLSRKGYAVIDQHESDLLMVHNYGSRMPDEKELARRAKIQADAIELHERAQALNAECSNGGKNV